MSAVGKPVSGQRQYLKVSSGRRMSVQGALRIVGVEVAKPPRGVRFWHRYSDEDLDEMYGRAVAGYRERMKTAHPDHGGTDGEAATLTAAMAWLKRAFKRRGKAELASGSFFTVKRRSCATCGEPCVGLHCFRHKVPGRSGPKPKPKPDCAWCGHPVPRVSAKYCRAACYFMGKATVKRA